MCQHVVLPAPQFQIQCRKFIATYISLEGGHHIHNGIDQLVHEQGFACHELAIAKNDPGTLRLRHPVQPVEAIIPNIVPIIKSDPRATASYPDDIDAFGYALNHAFHETTKDSNPILRSYR